MTILQKIIQLYNLDESENSFGYEEVELAAIETRLELKLPEKLRTYYLTLGKNTSINNAHNNLFKPTEIGFSNDMYLMFYEENQSVVNWGIKQTDLQLGNPPVWGNYGSNKLPDWQLEANTTDLFFLLMAIVNGTLGGLIYNANSFDTIKPEVVKTIKKGWTEIEEISWNKQKMYTNDFKEVISLSFDEKENCTAIYIGTNNKHLFDNIIDSLKIKWSYISTEDDEDVD